MGVARRSVLGALASMLIAAGPLAPARGLADTLPREEWPAWWDVDGPAAGRPAVYGSFSLGCVAGGRTLALSGPGFEVMRPSRNRFHGHPAMIDFLYAFAGSVTAAGWDGLLVGDIAQPRGGPMRSGHQSHQTGLDADIWFLAAPRHPLSMADRENMAAVSMLDASGTATGERFTLRERDLLRLAARSPAVSRIFVHPAIKQDLCDSAGGDRDALGKIRPWWGHHYHFHVRLACPESDDACVDQPPPSAGDGCDETLAWWFSEEARQQAAEMARMPKDRTPIPLDALPAACRVVLTAP